MEDRSRLKSILNIPNFLSFLRFPLAIIFISGGAVTRITAIAIAAATDFFDGFIARNYSQKSRFGTVLDPVADKFFVMTALALFLKEGSITPPQMCAMLCRDFSVIFFGLYLLATRQFAAYTFRSIWCGKITTTIQLGVLALLSIGVAVPGYFYTLFVILGITALVELYFSGPLPKQNALKGQP